MTRTYRDHEFEGIFDRDSGRCLSDMKFERCTFDWCGLSMTMDVSRRTRVERVSMVGCSLKSCFVGPALLNEITVDGLKTSDNHFLRGTVFRHVVLRGHVGKLLCRSQVDMDDATSHIQRTFDVANEVWYRDVDWALDITEADYDELELLSVPALLVRRDPDRQVIVTREKAMRREWESLDLSRTYWPALLDGFLRGGGRDVVLAAPREKSRRWPRLVEGLRLLQAAGIAEPG